MVCVGLCFAYMGQGRSKTDQEMLCGCILFSWFMSWALLFSAQPWQLVLDFEKKRYELGCGYIWFKKHYTGSFDEIKGINVLPYEAGTKYVLYFKLENERFFFPIEQFSSYENAWARATDLTNTFGITNAFKR